MFCRYNNLDELYHAKSEEGLSRLLAFLREEEERERLEQIERMKPIGTQVLQPEAMSSPAVPLSVQHHLHVMVLPSLMQA